MPQQLALILTYAFVLWLFLRDSREKPNITGALWLPLTWFLIIATRSPIEWCVIWGVPGFSGDMSQGKGNLDAIIYFSLTVAGAQVLMKRGFDISLFTRKHRWLVMLLLYSLMATTWADDSFVAFKRWIKILGHPIMALIVVTEPDPAEALRRLMKRSAYVILPISVMLIKYFPAIGRGGSGGWITELQNRGITTGKNQLGANCWILGLFLFWMLIENWPKVKGKHRKNELLLVGGLLGLNFWCLAKAGSATSWLVFLLGVFAIVIFGFRKLNKNYIGLYAVGLFSMIAFAESTFDISNRINAYREKHDTIEGRQRLQAFVLDMGTNPVLGAGFESFWSEERITEIWSNPLFQWQPNQAHNGYIEMYLNLGILGLFLLGAVILEVYQKIKRELLLGVHAWRLRYGYLLGVIAYNWTEAAYKGLSVVYFLLFLIAVTDSRRGFAPTKAVFPT